MSHDLGVPGVPGVSHPGVGRLFLTLSRFRGCFSGVSRVSRRISKTIARTSVRTHPHPHARSGFAFSPGHPGHPEVGGREWAEERCYRRSRCPTRGWDTPRTPQDTPAVAVGYDRREPSTWCQFNGSRSSGVVA